MPDGSFKTEVCVGNLYGGLSPPLLKRSASPPKARPLLFHPPPNPFEKKSNQAQLSPAEKLGPNLDVALDIDAQIMALGVDADNLKQTRIVGEASGRTLSTAVRVDEAQLRREGYRMANIDKLAGLLKEKYDDAGALLPKPKVIDHDR